MDDDAKLLRFCVESSSRNVMTEAQKLLEYVRLYEAPTFRARINVGSAIARTEEALRLMRKSINA